MKNFAIDAEEITTDIDIWLNENIHHEHLKNITKIIKKDIVMRISNFMLSPVGFVDDELILARTFKFNTLEEVLDNLSKFKYLYHVGHSPSVYTNVFDLNTLTYCLDYYKSPEYFIVSGALHEGNE